MFILEKKLITNKNLIFILIIAFCILPIKKSFSIDEDYSKAAGHTGVYVNSDTPNIWALKCNIKTFDHSDVNNKLGWYTAWPMIVDYKTGKFVQTGYITSPIQGIDKPTFYVAWSSNGKDIEIEYLPDKNSSGNALKRNFHEYAISLNSDGSVNVQIDGVKYLGNHPKTKTLNIGITEGTGEFFAEASNLNMEVKTKFTDCFYKVRGENDWKELEHNAPNTLYYIAKGTTIIPTNKNSFWITGKIKNINKGSFFKKIFVKK